MCEVCGDKTPLAQAHELISELYGEINTLQERIKELEGFVETANSAVVRWQGQEAIQRRRAEEAEVKNMMFREGHS